MAVSGDTVVVGVFPGSTIGADSGQGSAYVFVKPAGGWAGALTETAKLTASDGAVDDDFGIAVAVSGDTVVVGASRGPAFAATPSQGSAYVFVKPAGGWAGRSPKTAKLTASDGAAGDRLRRLRGRQRRHGGGGGVGDDIGDNPNQGSAYVFVKPAAAGRGRSPRPPSSPPRTGGGESMNSASPSPSAATRWWWGHVSLSAANPDCQGSAYVFVKPAGGWAGALHETAKLTASDGGERGMTSAFPWPSAATRWWWGRTGTTSASM